MLVMQEMDIPIPELLIRLLGLRAISDRRALFTAVSVNPKGVDADISDASTLDCKEYCIIYHYAAPTSDEFSEIQNSLGIANVLKDPTGGEIAFLNLNRDRSRDPRLRPGYDLIDQCASFLVE